ncbi:MULTISPECIES: hypothetical protein [unclassified Streptomyces]|uniref:hypothetical protein n=1 Tax=unclassified Streptomyces TaxID=2593676 RepID=UPI000DB98CE7|nr:MULTISPECIES: hypothetical protein [unclassified Streptomyces]MYT68339.1 hypothetical protein [Streptomyces sp. SID8367]
MATALAALALTSCSGGDSKGPEATLDPAEPSKTATSTAPSPTETDPDAALKKVVLDTYARMWEEQAKAYSKASIEGTQLRRYAAGAALADTEVTMDTFQKEGLVTKGAPTHDVTVTGLKPNKKVPWASLTDCMDTTGWKYLDKKTGKPAEMPKNQVLKYVTKVQAERWGGTWKIIVVDPSATSC